MSDPWSRWRTSVVTFGPMGRVLCTLVIIGVPVCLFRFGGLFGLAGVVIWCGWVLPGALMDTWQRAVLPSTDLARLRDITSAQLANSAGPARTT